MGTKITEVQISFETSKREKIDELVAIIQELMETDEVEVDTIEFGEAN